MKRVIARFVGRITGSDGKYHRAEMVSMKTLERLIVVLDPSIPCWAHQQFSLNDEFEFQVCRKRFKTYPRVMKLKRRPCSKAKLKRIRKENAGRWPF